MASDIAAVKAAVDAAFRDEWGRVVATLIRTTGEWDLAEGPAPSGRGSSHP